MKKPDKLMKTVWMTLTWFPNARRKLERTSGLLESWVEGEVTI